MPPDQIGILDGNAPRFVCAGRFVAAARGLGVPVATLGRALNQRDGAFHAYWRVGTTSGLTGESHWAAMRAGGFVSVGWKERVPDLSEALALDKAVARSRIRDWLLPQYADKSAVASRKAGEILNFAGEIAEMDLVLACDGQKVLGVGRVMGPYEYDPDLAFPHKRPVDWLLLEPWQTPEPEGLRTTVFGLGRSASNLLDLERRLFDKQHAPRGPERRVPPHTVTPPTALPALDAVAARIESILRRKGQVVLYGPPGTGKTFRALGVARDLAARHAFRRSFATLSEPERQAIDGPDGTVRLCTFHPGYGYEDFMEGLRPRTVNGQMVFEPRAGISAARHAGGRSSSAG